MIVPGPSLAEICWGFQIRRKQGHISSRSAQIGRHPPKLAETGPKLVQYGPKCGRHPPGMVEIGPSLARSWPDSDGIRPNSGRDRADSDRCRVLSVEFDPDSDGFLQPVLARATAIVRVIWPPVAPALHRLQPVRTSFASRTAGSGGWRSHTCTSRPRILGARRPFHAPPAARLDTNQF